MKIEAAAAIATGTMVFLAQTASGPDASPGLNLLTQLVSALGPMGFVMWLVHRTTTHTIPRLAKSFEEGIDRQRTDFKEILTQQRTDLLSLVEREQAGRDKLAEAVARMGKG